METEQQSDNGQESINTISNATVNQLLSKLTKKDNRIIKMLLDGYTQKEVIKATKTNYPYINRLRKKIATLLK